MALFRAGVGNWDFLDLVEGERRVAIQSFVFGCHLACTIRELPRRVSEYRAARELGASTIETLSWS